MVERLRKAYALASTTQHLGNFQECKNNAYIPVDLQNNSYFSPSMRYAEVSTHQQLDLTVDHAPFNSDEEPLENLFERYEAMIAAEQKVKK